MTKLNKLMFQCTLSFIFLPGVFFTLVYGDQPNKQITANDIDWGIEVDQDEINHAKDVYEYLAEIPLLNNYNGAIFNEPAFAAEDKRRPETIFIQNGFGKERLILFITNNNHHIYIESHRYFFIFPDMPDALLCDRYGCARAIFTTGHLFRNECRYLKNILGKEYIKCEEFENEEYARIIFGRLTVERYKHATNSKLIQEFFETSEKTNKREKPKRFPKKLIVDLRSFALYKNILEGKHKKRFVKTRFVQKNDYLGIEYFKFYFRHEEKHIIDEFLAKTFKLMYYAGMTPWQKQNIELKKVLLS